MLSKKLLCAFLIAPNFVLASPIHVTLNNGDTLTVDIIEQSADDITVSHHVLGNVSIDMSQVTSITSLANHEPSNEKTFNAKDNGLFNTGLLTGWVRQFDIGVSGSAGKSRNQKVNIGFNADFDSDATRISSKTAFYSARSDGERTDSSFYTAVNRDWLQPDTPWFSFAGSRFDWDEFKDWDYRINANTGIGYEFIKTDHFLFVGRSGLSANQTLGGERKEFTPEGLLGIETKWAINDHQLLKFTNTLYPSLKDSSDFRNLSSLDWQLDLNTVNGVALKLGLLNEYDSATEDNISKNDFKYIASLSWRL